MFTGSDIGPSINAGMGCVAVLMLVGAVSTIAWVVYFIVRWCS